MMKPTGQLVRVGDISRARRDEMYALMETYYENMTRTTFDRDLEQKEWVTEIEDGVSGRLKGFSTQVLWHLPIDGRSIRVVLSLSLSSIESRHPSPSRSVPFELDQPV